MIYHGSDVDMTGRQQMDDAYEELACDLGKRIKELSCLYRVSELAGNIDISIDEMLEAAIEHIPTSWQYPEVTCARVTYNEKKFTTEDYKDTDWKQSADIFVGAARKGVLEICYLEERPFEDEGPFLTEERRLINSLAGNLGRSIEHRLADRAVIEREQELKDLVDIAAHELRHPATIFRGYTNILLENWDDLDKNTIREALKKIDSATMRLTTLIVQLLETSRIENGKLAISLTMADPVSPVRRAVEEAIVRWGGEHEFRLSCEDLEPVKLDDEKVKRVLVILLENAVKFSQEGSIVSISCVRGEGEIVYGVADSGAGIPEEHREKIFKKFYQVEDVYHHSAHGIGLGLFIASSILEAHRGWIKVDPLDGGGSVFSFGIPGGP